MSPTFLRGQLTREGFMLDVDPFALTLVLLGIALIGAAWLPHLVSNRPLSFPIVYVVLGAVLFSLPLPLPDPDPRRYGEFTERLTELVVIISLMGVGLRMDRRIGWQSWNVTWRLLVITMPLCIALAACLGYSLMGLGLASALLFGAALAPTDPVLASDVQVGPPGDRKTQDDVRFALTSEAGLNDGLGFPFTFLAIGVALYGIDSADWLTTWLWRDLVWRVFLGAVMGAAFGFALTWLIFRAPVETSIARASDGLVALAVTLLVYGATQLAGGYGFLAVFIAAMTIRLSERNHKYNATLETFAEQCERTLVTVLLVLFGGALTTGLLDFLDRWTVLAVLIFLLVVRPATGMLGLLGSHLPMHERLAISSFGIRGMGSFYYLAFALNQAQFERGGRLWSAIAFAVLVSIVIHGVSASAVMSRLDRHRKRRERGAA